MKGNLRLIVREAGGFLLTRWLFASGVLGASFGLILDAGIRAASSDASSVGALVDEGAVIASALTLEIEWLLVAWHTLVVDRQRRAVFVANATVFMVLAIIYAAIRIDVVAAPGAVFRADVIRASSMYGALAAGITTVLTAIIVRREVMS